MYGDTITRQRAAAAQDRYGDDLSNWTTPTTAVIPAAVQPVGTDEQITDRDSVTTRYRVHTAPTEDIVATDRIVWRTATFDVLGDVEQHSRKGAPHHLEFVIQRTAG